MPITTNGTGTKAAPMKTEKDSFEDKYDEIASREDARRSPDAYVIGPRPMAIGEYILGTVNDDILSGSDVDSLIDGKEGDDTINGGGGDDVLRGGDGADTVEGASGADTLWGGGQDDFLYGETGNDRLFGESGNDRCYGGEGEDRIWGKRGNDELYGGDDSDILSGNGGADLIFGDAGDDRLRGNSGNDELHGGAGDDRLIGGGGDDTMYGDGNNDALVGRGGDDIAHGGDGDDILRGGGDNDTLYGDAGADKLIGQSGVDYLYGGFGDDMLFGGEDDDWLDGGDGLDRLYGNDGNDNLRGRDDADLLLGQGGDDRLIGDAGEDILRGGNGDDRLDGGDDDDVLYGDAGNDFLYGDGAEDVLYGGDGDDTLEGGGGEDELHGGAGADSMDGGSGRDVYYADTGDTVFETGGVDFDVAHVSGDGAFTLGDYIEVMSYNGSLAVDAAGGATGSDHDNLILGGDMDNALNGAGGGDVLIGGGGGDDVLRGGDGADHAVFSGDYADYTIGADVDLSGGDTVVNDAGGESDFVAEMEFLRFNDGYYDTGTQSFTAYDPFDASVTQVDLEDMLPFDTHTIDLPNDLDWNAAEVITVIGDAGDAVYFEETLVFELDGGITVGGRVFDHYAYGNCSIWIDTQVEVNPEGDLLDATITGTDGPELIVGTTGSDYIQAGQGDDVIVGNGGSDVIVGSTIYGQGGVVYTGGFLDYNIQVDATDPDAHLVIRGNESDGLFDINEVYFNDGYMTADTGWFRPLDFSAAHVYGYENDAQDVIDGDALLHSLAWSRGRDEIHIFDGDIGDTLTLDMSETVMSEDVLFYGDSVYLHYVWGTANIFIDVDIDLNPVSAPAFGDGGNSFVDDSYDETLFGAAAGETLTGTDSDDYINGFTGADTLNGGAGDDYLESRYDAGNGATMNGGDGDDVYYADTLDTVTENASEGFDTVIMNAGTYTLAANVEALVYNGEDMGTGNADGNLLIGGGRDNGLYGDDGDDVLAGGAGDDVIDGGDGTDYALIAADYNTDITISAGTSGVLSGGDVVTNDTTGETDHVRVEYLFFNDAYWNGAAFVDYDVDAAGQTQVDLTNADDVDVYEIDLHADLDWQSMDGFTIRGDAGDTVVFDDLLVTYMGQVTQDATVFNHYNFGMASIWVEDGVIVNPANGAPMNDVLGTASANTLTGTEYADFAQGLGGDDEIYGLGGDDLITGWYGDDELRGGDGNDTMRGDGGEDHLHGGDGDDILDGGLHDDDLWGDDGADTFNFSNVISVDMIHDFDEAEGDVLRFSDILGGYDPGGGDVITDWVLIEDSGADSTVSVDLDGAGAAYAMTQVAVLDGVTGLTDEAALEAGGTIVI